ncbi:MAG: mechanosensitive ion channel family protein [Phycisphaerales bacterium]|nr:mechanosensitive ion channel family protein [Phycisphaerales bacterium]
MRRVLCLCVSSPSGWRSVLQLIHLESGLFDFTLRIVKFLYLLALGWFLYNLVDVLDLWLTDITAKTDSKLDDMLVPLVRKTLRIFLILVFSLVVAQNVFGLNITGWLAGLGIAGLAVSLAAQDSIKNLFGSITVFFDRPFSVGDFINFEGQDAVVEEIGFRSTRMRTLDGHLVSVPNMKFIDGSVRNISERESMRRVLDVTITYDTPPEKIQRAIQSSAISWLNPTWQRSLINKIIRPE